MGAGHLNLFTHLCNKNVDFQGSWGGEVEGFIRGFPILENKEFPHDKLTTHKLPLTRLNEIMKVPDQGYILDGKESLKITASSEIS